MRFSLLVVTTDRLHAVKRLFRSLEAQTCKDFSVVFVHEETCAARAAELARRCGGIENMTLLPVSVCGVSRARNRGLPLCGGDIIAFPDDDCVYAPHTLAAAAEMFRLYPEADGLLAAGADAKTTGHPATPGHEEVDDTLRTSGPEKIRRDSDVADNLPPSGERTGRARPVNRYAVFGDSETWRQFYRRRCVESVGAFDERLGAGSGYPYGSGEDTDYALRVLRAGFRVLRAPSVTVRHPAPDVRDPGLGARIEAYACGRMYLLRKHSLPLWFRLANVLYPLAALALDIPRAALPVIAYRRRMFAARLAHFQEKG
jgi:glycosyltransferase involved in cell wall biosynthesis